MVLVLLAPMYVYDHWTSLLLFRRIRGGGKGVNGDKEKVKFYLGQRGYV